MLPLELRPVLSLEPRLMLALEPQPILVVGRRSIPCDSDESPLVIMPCTKDPIPLHVLVPERCIPFSFEQLQEESSDVAVTQSTASTSSTTTT